jgi:hypothetical protein
MTRVALFLAVALGLGAALGQLAAGSDPGSVADAALREWLAERPADLPSLGAMTPEELCEVLPGMLLSPPPPEGTSVNFSARREQIPDSSTPGEAAEARLYSYPASLPSGALEVVDVRVERAEGGWVATRVGFHVDTAPQGIRAWLQEPLAAWLFIGFSLLVLWWLARPSFFRRWLAAGWATIRRYRQLVIVTQVALYSLFFVGAFLGSQLPPNCGTAIMDVLSTAVTTLGATDAYGSGNLARAAVVTFYQNFVMVSVVFLFSLSVLFGVPAYLFGSFSFFAQGIPFGLVGGLDPLQFVMIGVLLALELTAYFLVIAGGGILLATVIREGMSAFGTGVRRAAQMLPFAMLLLLVGAWYEAAVIILPTVLGAP